MSKTRIAINGFGRIGRLALRSILQRDDMKVVAINDLADPAALAYLFEYDSVHGRYQGDVSYNGEVLVVDGVAVPMIQQTDPAACGWGALGVDVLLESTGKFVERDKAALHLDAGAKRVLISAPGKNVDYTVCKGVNDDGLDPTKHLVVSNASCTTNCVAPPIKALHDAFRVTWGMINTIHAYTISQGLLDSPKKKLRQGRAAALNLVPTSTGAAKAVGLVMPDLNGKLDGLAIRTPNPSGSIADITLTFEKDPTVAEAHAVLEAFAAKHPDVLLFSRADLVSTDIVGDTHSSIVDSAMTMKMGSMLKVLAWYDNEAGYAARLVEMGARMAEF